PRMPSGPGVMTCVARDSTMKFVELPGTNSGSSGWSGMITVPLPPLFTRSRPWSKNWPKNVNIRLNGADRPKSGVMFGMNNAPEFGSVTAARLPGGEHTNPPEPHGFDAAATAAGFEAV